MSFQKDPIEAYIRDESDSGAVKIEGGGTRPEFVAEP